MLSERSWDKVFKTGLTFEIFGFKNCKIELQCVLISVGHCILCTYEDYSLFTTLEQYVGILAHCQNQKTAIRFRFFAKDRIKAFKKVTR